MPLSDEEQRLLEEMERSLYHNDADDVATVGGARNRPNYTAIVLGVIAGVLGLAGLIVGVMLRQPAIGLFGFAVMFAGALLAIAPPRRLSVDNVDPTKPGSVRKRPSFMESLNDRWERRTDGDER